MRTHRCIFFLIVGLLPVCLVTLAAAELQGKPNIIVIFSDDHGWADIGAQGIQKDIRTPHIDALATGGLRASNGYVTAPQCVPSRAGLLAGRYQPRFGVESNGAELGGFNKQVTIAERLKKAGYATGMTGKWHLGPISEITQHGFDDVYADQGGGGAWANMDLEGNRTEGAAIKSTVYHLEANAAAACAFIKRHKGEPFFFYLAYRAPHVPLDAPKKYLDRFPGEMPERRRQCLAMMSAVDDGIGRVLQTLREHGLEEKTLIFFMGDNGAPLKIHKLDEPGGGPGWDGSLNAPMNGEKGMLTEGGIRVPWVAYWKDVITPGQVYQQPVISVDVAATAVALAGLPPDPALDGVNLIPFFTGQKDGAPHEVIFWRWEAQSAIREGKWKLLVGGPREYLFDLVADPEEKQNLLVQNPEIVKRLRARLETWGGELEPPGINIKPMAKTWDDYYDYYLDNKHATSPGGAGQQGAASDWVARNATAEVKDGALMVTPGEGGKQRHFMACAKLSVPGPAKATLTIRTEKGGRAGISWRLDGQKDFAADQTVEIDLAASGDWQEKTIELPANGQIIHLRVLLPEGVAAIRRIGLTGANAKASKTWDFSL
jgi:uncharacterized sulfatase